MFPGSTLTEAFGINNRDQVVGLYSNGTSTEGFLYSGGTYTTLSFPGNTDTQAWGINDRGQIVGLYFNSVSVPGPIIGAGLPGLIVAGGGLLAGGATSDALKRLPEFAPDFALRAAIVSRAWSATGSISMPIYSVARCRNLLLRPAHTLWVLLIEKSEFLLTHTLTRYGAPPS